MWLASYAVALWLLELSDSMQLQWKDEYGLDVHLQGPPLFVRACVLGQLQHSHLHKPSTPLYLHKQQLTFDRVRSTNLIPS